MINWIPNVTKAYEAMAYVAQDPIGYDIHKMWGALFEADLLHMRTYGRSIYGEHWDVAWHGVRPQVASGLLSGDQSVHAMLDPEKRPDNCPTPWALRLNSLGGPNLDMLSPSDLECLDAGLERVRSEAPRDTILRIMMDPVVAKAKGGTLNPRDMLNPPFASPAHIANLEAAMATCVF